MSRTTLQNLIHRIRTMTHASVSAYTIGTANYWDNTQIMLLLDTHRYDIWSEELSPLEDLRGSGTIHYYTYRSQFNHLEETLGGTAIFYIEDNLGGTIASSNYSVDYTRGLITFTADQGGSARYMTARSYNLNSTAVDLLEAWAAQLKLSAFDFQSDDQEMLRNQKIKNILALAERYRQNEPLTTQQLYRSDIPGRWEWE